MVLIRAVKDHSFELITNLIRKLLAVKRVLAWWRFMGTSSGMKEGFCIYAFIRFHGAWQNASRCGGRF